MINLLDMDREQLDVMFDDKPYRGSQIFEWVFGKGIRDVVDMSNIPAKLREEISQKASIVYPEVIDSQISSDGTQKIAYRLYDGNIIESVLMEEKKHWSVCISSQAGCSMRCSFCCTATLGFIRNLSAGEILSQVLHPIHAFPDKKIRNVVFMGMGEPLLNYENVLQAVRIMTDRSGPQISKRRVTISTCGIIPKLKELCRDTDAGLAVSLNAPNNEIRQTIMPVSRKYPLEELIEALRGYQLPNRRRITIEYVLLSGINDSAAHARELIRLLHGLKVKVNIIPFNPWPGSGLTQPDRQTVNMFEEELKNSPIAVMVRKEKGKDIMAACGQLAGGKNNEQTRTG